GETTGFSADNRRNRRGDHQIFPDNRRLLHRHRARDLLPRLRPFHSRRRARFLLRRFHPLRYLAPSASEFPWRRALSWFHPPGRPSSRSGVLTELEGLQSFSSDSLSTWL